ncbi:hypothetical protein SRCM100623_00463 [Acetobacter pasteurianus]|uniref:Integrase n=1 Tax=Acetobacter pasteurianus TaxID=438 RepID=A0A1A0DJ76_ACEPA|nr:DUF6538 domain-containing protein [Acetobacter pasteurianus]OAZ75040.1 hypothetical protein SRCM100623_00463 [Acetobacter pasteurianus]
MATPYMTQRRNCWYLRVRNPADLRPVVGCYVVKSLKTHDRMTARNRAVALVATLSNIWNDMRQKLAQAITAYRDEQITASDLKDFLTRHQEEISQLPEKDIKAVAEWMKARIGLLEHDVRKDREHLEHLTILTDAWQEAHSKGVTEGLERAIKLGGVASPAPVVSVVEETAESDTYSMTPWPDLVEEFFRDHPGYSKKTISAYKTTMKQVLAVIGRKPMRDMTKADVKRYADHLRDTPGRDGQVRKTKTIERQMSEIRTFMAWAVSCGYVADRGFADVKGRGRTLEEKQLRQEDIRRAFTSDELKRFFNTPLFLGSKSSTMRALPGNYRHRDHDFWFMMIMALTGARDAEIAYASSELYYLKDIPCIDLRKSGTKTQNSPRLIPVLPQLQQVGFLEWAKRQKAKGRSLVESPTGVISVDAWSKRGNRYLRQVGYTDKALVLYSFRHTFRQVLRTSGLHPEIVNRIFGHETGEVGSGYGSNLSYEEARLFMDKVKYPVFLDHLADRNGTFLW